VPDANVVQQGAGLLNIEGATRIAGALRTDIASKVSQGNIQVGDTMLAAGASMPGATSVVAGQAFGWGGYIFAGGCHILAGAELITRFQAIYDPRLVWVSSRITRDGSPVSSGPLISSGVIDAGPIVGAEG